MPTKNVSGIRAILIKVLLKEPLDLEENAQLSAWKASSEENQKFFDELSDIEKVKSNFAEYRDLIDWKHTRPFRLDTAEKSILRRLNSHRIWIAAAAIFFIGVVTFFYLFLVKTDTRDKHAGNEVADRTFYPARQQAILSVGKKSYVLDSLSEGQTIDGATKQGGSLRYSNDNNDEAEHRVSTPYGGFYNLTLPDGTKVWLNAGTEIVYRPGFPGKERRIQLNGEAYLEVSKDNNKPFIVETASGSIKVTGTKFDVKSYPVETMVTTLLEGSVKVLAGENSRDLVPGNQMQLNPNTRHAKFVEQADIGSAIGWKEGVFAFEDVPLPEALNEIERWYNVRVTYVNNKDQIRSILNGDFERTMNLNDLVKVLAKVSKVKFTLKGSVLEVQP